MDPTEDEEARREFVRALEEMLMAGMVSHREVLRAHGLTMPQFMVLAWVKRDGPTSLSSLAQRLEVAPQSVTSLVDALEHRGWITRTPVPSDRRSSRVALTTEGMRLAGEIRSFKLSLIEKALESQPAEALREAALVFDAVRKSMSVPPAPVVGAS